MTSRQLAFAAVSIAAAAPPGLGNRLPVTCLFRRITGRPCPTCGLTRSWSATAHGRLGTGFRHHPFGPLTFVAALAIAVAGPQVADRPAFRSAPVVGGAAAAWLLVWLARLVRRSGVS